MADINFYHLSKSTIKQALPRLLEKILQGGKNCLLVADNQDSVKEIDAYLWSSTRIFLPHGTLDDKYPEKQPIFVTCSNDNPNNSEVLIFAGSIDDRPLDNFEKSMLLFDGNNPNQIANARKYWKIYSGAGHNVIYWKQNDKGKWEKGL